MFPGSTARNNQMTNKASLPMFPITIFLFYSPILMYCLHSNILQLLLILGIANVRNDDTNLIFKSFSGLILNSGCSLIFTSSITWSNSGYFRNLVEVHLLLVDSMRNVQNIIDQNRNSRLLFLLIIPAIFMLEALSSFSAWIKP